MNHSRYTSIGRRRESSSSDNKRVNPPYERYRRYKHNFRSLYSSYILPYLLYDIGVDTLLARCIQQCM